MLRDTDYPKCDPCRDVQPVRLELGYLQVLYIGLY